jgi:hypothetical protein
MEIVAHEVMLRNWQFMKAAKPVANEQSAAPIRVSWYLAGSVK